MSDPKQYYKVLGLQPNSSISDVKKAYHKLAILYHPDKVNGDKEKVKAKEKFVKISEAYEVLSDEKKKKDYDAYGSFDMQYEKFFRNNDEIFNYFNNIFREHMKLFDLKFDFNFDDDSKKFENSKYKSIRKFSETKYVDGKKLTTIREIINDNGLVREKNITIDDKGNKKENIKTIDNRKKNEVLKIDEKKRPNF
jgi:DnaJ-class molecular chaperone